MKNEKTAFYVAEVNSVNSYREAEKIMAKDLASAKRIASRGQCFCGTVLYIGESVNDEGFIVNPICYKKDGSWHDC